MLKVEQEWYVLRYGGQNLAIEKKTVKGYK